MAKGDHAQLLLQAVCNVLFDLPDAIVGHLFLVIGFCQLLQLLIRDVNSRKPVLLNGQLLPAPNPAEWPVLYFRQAELPSFSVKQ